MRRRLVLVRGLGAFGGGALLAHAVGAVAARRDEAARLHWRETALPLLGTTAWLRAGHADASVVDGALADAVAALRRVDDAANLYRADSALSRLNRDGGLATAPAELLQLLRAAGAASRISAGAFDATVQPLWRLWADAAAAGLRPEAGALRDVRRQVDWRAVRVEAQAVRLTRPGMSVTLNGIAQGFAAERAADALHRRGIAHALVDCGEWQPLGRSPEGGPWQLGVAAHAGTGAPLLARLHGDGRAIACTADDGYRFGTDPRDHHVLDPRTGRSPTALARVVVAAQGATWADALTKPLMMAPGLDAALALARRLGIDALVVARDGRWRASPGMPLAA